MKMSSITKSAPAATAAGLSGASRQASSRAAQSSVDRRLDLEPAACAICGDADSEPVGLGEDFEYRTSADSFLAVRCRSCGLIYLDPRPASSALPLIYPDSYHAFDFSPRKFGVIYRVRGWLEMRRLLGATRGLEAEARIPYIGCGDGFHLGLLRRFGSPSWRLEGIDIDRRAIAMARQAGFAIHDGAAETAPLPESSYDLVLLIQTIEHLDNPLGVLRAIRRALKPGGQLIVVTDNAASLDARIFSGRHWGGYHFPRHWNLFDARSLRLIAEKAELETVALSTLVSPVNWLYSIHNLLADWGCSPRVLRAFSLKSAPALAAFTLFAMPQQWLGHGALLRCVMRRAPDRPEARNTSS
jgi:SAM-dependent methyltransferase